MQRKVIHGSTIESCELTFEKWKEHTAQLLQSSRQPLALVRIANVSGAEHTLGIGVHKNKSSGGVQVLK